MIENSKNINKLKPVILIIDDEKGLRLGTKRLLESEGFYVQAAENGTEGIRLGTEMEFDIVIIDLKMPDYDGLEVLQEIKKVHPNSVCMIATAFASYETAIEATQLGAYSYIPKPFAPEELLYKIDQAFKHRLLKIESERLKKEREENLLELAYEKSRMNTIVKSINEGIVIINKTGEIVYFNNATLKNLDIDELKIGDKAVDKLPNTIIILVNKYLNSSENIKKSFSTQVEVKPDNKLFVEAVCSPVPHTDESLAGVIVVIRNITEFKKIEMIKSQFVSMVAHELKAPVAAVQGFLNLMLDEKMGLSDEKKKEFLSRSEKRLNSLLTLVNDLLDISRMEMKTKQREMKDIDIKECIDSTVDLLQFESAKRNISVTTSYGLNLPLLFADNNEITRMFTNILSNAVKYNRDNGTINIEVTAVKNYVCIKVSDTGIGLKTEEKLKLFSEFFRAKNENTRGISGTGLGLTIVKRIIDSYHGKIEVESEYGKGTTFIIHLPINTK